MVYNLRVIFRIEGRLKPPVISMFKLFQISKIGGGRGRINGQEIGQESESTQIINNDLLQRV